MAEARCGKSHPGQAVPIVEMGFVTPTPMICTRCEKAFSCGCMITNVCPDCTLKKRQAECKHVWPEEAEALQLCLLCSVGKAVDQAALDRLYESVDAMMKDGRLKDLSQELSSVEVGTTSVDILLGYLTATLPVKDTLESRTDFFERVQLELVKRGEDPLPLLFGLQ